MAQKTLSREAESTSGHTEGPIKVTISDPETGKVLEEMIISNDYVLVTAGNRYLKHIQVMGRTHMLAVAVQKPEAR